MYLFLAGPASAFGQVSHRLCLFNVQLAVERSKSDEVQSASTVKRKKRKHNREASGKSDTRGSAKTETDATFDTVKVKVEPEFVAHDYGKANLTSLLQGTF